MFKRRATLDNNDKIRRNRQTEYFMELDKCLQIPSDDKLIIRKCIKDNNSEVLAVFEFYKKEKNYTDMQVRLRKFVQFIKAQEKRNPTGLFDRRSNDSQKIYSQQSQNASNRTSNRCSPEKEEVKRKIITLDINQLKKRIEAHHRNTLVITPSTGQNSVRNIRKDSVVSPNGRIQNTKENVHPNQSQQTKMSTCASSKTFQMSIPDSSRSTYRLKQQRQSSERLIIEQGKASRVEKQNEMNCLSYSSSIRNLLVSKLKEGKGMQLDGHKIEGCFREEEVTILKKPIKPILRDQSNYTLNYTDQSVQTVPMFIQSDEKSTECDYFGSKTKKTSYFEQQINFADRNRRGLQIIIDEPEQPMPSGLFYNKIRRIIDADAD